MTTNPTALWPRVQAGIVRMLEVSSREELTMLSEYQSDRALASFVTGMLQNHGPIDGQTYITEEERDLVFERLAAYADSLRTNIQAAVDGQTVPPHRIQLWTHGLPR